MHSDLATRRRALLITYQRYLEADRAWEVAISDMQNWFPKRKKPSPLTIGNPGSPIRRLYERRELALMQLEAARQKFETAKQRLATRHQEAQVSRVVLLTYKSH